MLSLYNKLIPCIVVLLFFDYVKTKFDVFAKASKSG